MRSDQSRQFTWLGTSRRRVSLGLVAAGMTMTGGCKDARVDELTTRVATLESRIDTLRSYLADDRSEGIGPESNNTAFYTWLQRIDDKVKTHSHPATAATSGPPIPLGGGDDTHGPPPPPPGW